MGDVLAWLFTPDIPMSPVALLVTANIGGIAGWGARTWRYKRDRR